MRRSGAIIAVALVAVATGAGDAVAGGADGLKSGPFRYVTSVAPVAATDDGVHGSACPVTSRLTGGGGRISGPVDDVRLGGIFPFDFFDPGSIPDDTYLAEGYNNSDAQQALRATAICLKNGAGGSSLDYNDNDGSAINMGASVGTIVSVTCSSGRLVGGGLEIPGPATTQFEEQLNSSHPSDTDSNGVYDNGWSGRLNVNASTVNRTPRAHAVCLPAGTMKVRYPSTAEVVLPGTTPTLKAKCPKGKGWHVSGGGIQGFFSRIRTSLPLDSKDKGKAPDDGWKGTVVISQFGDPAAMVVRAICLKKA